MKMGKWGNIFGNIEEKLRGKNCARKNEEKKTKMRKIKKKMRKRLQKMRKIMKK